MMDSVQVASRDHLCLNKELRQEFRGKDLSKECSVINYSNKKCEFFHGKASSSKGIMNELKVKKHLDIEEFIEVANSHNHCPYYLANSIVKQS